MLHLGLLKLDQNRQPPHSLWTIHFMKKKREKKEKQLILPQVKDPSQIRQDRI